MKYDSRLIRKPYAQPRLKRAAWGFVTAAFWGLVALSLIGRGGRQRVAGEP